MQSHYDVIIIGDSLAARVAAVQLARSGCRVLALEEGLAISPAWFTSSLHLEKLLEQLSGRSCLTPPPSFQVITPTARVDLASRRPLDEVLLREFPEDYATLLELFGSLQKRGELLENTLLQTGRAPLKGLGGQLRFRWKALRNGLRLSSGKTLLATHLQTLKLGSPSGDFVRTLFAGLSLSPFEQLSLAEAALIWTSHTREHGASASGLDTLLRQRFEQFHGHSAPLENLKHIDATQQQVQQVVLKNGSTCTADFYLMASSAHLHRLSPAVSLNSLKLPQGASRAVTSALQGSPSPLLSSRVILGGPAPLRLSFGKRGDETLCAIDIPGGISVPSQEQLGSQLMPILPFCSYQLEMPASANTPDVASVRANRFGQQTSVRLLRNTLLCHGASIFPSLGTNGEVLLGSSLANYMLSRKPKK